jgi:hypothetical protein
MSISVPVDAEPGAAVAGSVSATAERSKPLVFTILTTLLAVSVFTLVVHLAHFGFAARFGDPLGYLYAILKPLALTLPAYLLLRVALGLGAWKDELGGLARSIDLAALSIACYAPVIWFYLLTSPTPTFPLIALLFGALTFWVPLAIDLVRRAQGKAKLIAMIWVALMLWGESRSVIDHLGNELDRAAIAGQQEGER